LEATNAIVFMLVCINSHFKIPVAYYFINALSGVEKKPPGQRNSI